MREWYDGLCGINPPLTVNEMMMFDTLSVLQQMECPDRIAILREVMIGPCMSDEELFETVPSMSDEELLEDSRSVAFSRENESVVSGVH